MRACSVCAVTIACSKAVEVEVVVVVGPLHVLLAAQKVVRSIGVVVTEQKEEKLLLKEQRKWEKRRPAGGFGKSIEKTRKTLN